MICSRLTQSQRSKLLRGVAFVSALLAALFLFCPAASGAPVSADKAKQLVTRWIGRHVQPLGTGLGRVAKVQTFKDGATVLYHVVGLDPDGFVIVAGDDEAEPIVAFTGRGKFDSSTATPLGALVSSDLPGRVSQAQFGAAAFASRAKWDNLLTSGEVPATGTSSISEERVSPFVETRWNQGNAGSGYCYNYYTPNHYVCGCVATAMAQVMRYWQHPTSSVGTPSFTIYVDGTAETRSLRGGDGSGGPYDWANMPLVPSSGMSDEQRQAVGALCYDAGVAANMQYSSGGSGAYLSTASRELREAFGYANSVYGSNSGGGAGDTLNKMINPNLDAGRPVMLGIFGDGGHAIVCDGYGYNEATLYHHLNLGWGGAADAWYNLPNIDTGYYTFDSVDQVIYNIYKIGSGEIVSGRVTDANGDPVDGVTVTATKTGGSYSATTNGRGIYAIDKVATNSTYTVTAAKSGYTFTSQQAVTGRSSDYSSASGNVWGVNFVGAAGPDARTLTVQSAPVSGVAITGTCQGSTSYAAVLEDGTEVTLTAPETFTAGDYTYVFLRWTVGGIDKAAGVRTTTFTVSDDTTAVAAYELAPELAVATTALADGAVGTSYAASVQATGGVPGYTWSVLPGEQLAAAQTPSGGTPRGWRDDDGAWSLSLPFAFPFAGSAYSSVYVCSNGYIDFASSAADYSNTVGELAANVRIAPIWDDLKTNGSAQPSEDIYTSQPDAHTFVIRWVAETYWASSPVDVAVVLHDTGDIEFRYGPGNANLSPTVGISAGDGSRYVLSSHDAEGTLGGAQTVGFTPLHPGLGLSTAGAISGTPQAAGTRLCRFYVEDSSGATAARDLAITVDDTARQFAVQSTPVDGVAIGGDLPGTTQYTETCDLGTVVAVSAPATLAGHTFDRWEDDQGTPLAATPAMDVAIDGDKTVVAVYAENPPALAMVDGGDVDFGMGGIENVYDEPNEYTVRNDGGGTLEVTVTVDEPFYVLTPASQAVNTYSFSLAAGESQTFGCSWRPEDYGGQDETLAIASNGGSRSYTLEGFAFGALILWADASPESGPAPLTVDFDCEDSCPLLDPDYEWDFGDGATSTSDSPTHTYTEPGTYTVTVVGVDDIDRVGMDTLTIEVTGTPPQLEVTGATPVAFGDVLVGQTGEQTNALEVRNTGGGTLEVTVSVAEPFHVLLGGSPVAQRSFSLGAGQSEALSFDFAPAAGGAASRTISITSNGGSASRTATGTGITPISVEATATPDTGAPPLLVQFEATCDGVAPFTWAWAFGDGATSSQQSPTHPYATAALYTATVTVTDSRGLTGSDTVSIAVSPPPVADAGPDQSVEVGDLVALDGSASHDGTGSPDNVALAANGASITGTNGANWSQLIDGNSTVYDGGSGYGYTLWDTSPAGTMTVTLAQIYTLSRVRAKLWDGSVRYYQYKVEVATSASGPWTLVVDRTSGQHIGWCEDTFESIAARYIRITGTYNSANAGFHVVEFETYAGAPLTYQWTQVSGPDATLSDPTAVQPTFTPTAPGEYVFDLVVHCGELSSEADRVVITVTETVEPPVLQMVEGTNVDFGMGGIDNAYTEADAYVIRNSGGGTLEVTMAIAAPFYVLPQGGPRVNSHSFSLAAGQSVTVGLEWEPETYGGQSGTLSITSNGGSASYSASGFAFGDLYIWAEASPETGSAPLTVNFSCTDSCPLLDPDYTWDFGDGTTGTGPSPSHTYTEAGTYTVNVVGIDDIDREGTDSLTISVSAPLSPALEVVSGDDLDFGYIQIGTTATEAGAFVVRNAGTGTLDVTVAVPAPFGIEPSSASLGAGQTASFSVGFTPTVVSCVTQTLSIASNGGSASYSVTGCGVGPLLIEASATPDTGEAPCTVDFGCTDSCPLLDPNYTWDFGDGTTGTGPSPSHTYTEPGTYTVTVVGIDDIDREGTDSLTIDVTPPPAPQTVSVSSTPISDVAISGTCAGTTSYQTTVTQGSLISLTAPSLIVRGVDQYTFMRWEWNGADQPAGAATLSVTVGTDSAALARYEHVPDDPPEVANVRFDRALEPGGGVVRVLADVTDENGAVGARCTVTFGDGDPVTHTMQRIGGTAASGTWATGWLTYPSNCGPEALTCMASVVAWDAIEQEGTATSQATQEPVPPALSVTPTTTVWFGNVDVGQPRTLSAFTVTNTGGGSVTGAVTVDAPFEVVVGDAFSLGHGESQCVEITFDPTDSGTVSAAVDFDTNAGTARRTVTGYGVTHPALEVVSEGAIDFGTVTVGDAVEVEEAYVVRNVGTGTLHVTLSIPAPFQIWVGDGLPATYLTVTLGTGEQEAVGAVFAPFAAGQVQRILSITSNGGRCERAAMGTGVLPEIAVVASDPLAAEPGTDTGQLTFTRTGTTGGALDVACYTRGTAANGIDCDRLPTTVTFPAGEATATVTVTPRDDTLVEVPETVEVVIWSTAGYTAARGLATATVTILDDEPVVGIIATDPEASEAGTDPAQFTVVRRGSAASQLTVRYFAQGTALQGVDYQRLAGVVTIPAGETSAPIDIVPIDDTYAEGSETVTVQVLRGVTHSVEPDHDRATATIADDEAVVTVTATDPDAAEAGDPGQFTLTRSGGTASALTVWCAYLGTAAYGYDYGRPPVVVTFPAGEAVATVDIVPRDDPYAEGAETVQLLVIRTWLYGTEPGQDRATVTIADDEPVVTVVANDPEASEGGDPGQFTLTRSGSTASALTVWCTYWGTAAYGWDYERTPVQVTFEAGEPTATVDLVPLDDPYVERAETVQLIVLRTWLYGTDPEQDRATVTIADDEPMVAVEASDPDASEAGDPGQFTLTRSGSAAAEMTVRCYYRGSASWGSDYAQTPFEVTFPAGETAATVDIVPRDDTYAEGAETVELWVYPTWFHGTDPARQHATVTLADNEPMVSVAATDPDASESGDPGQFTLVRSGSLASALTVWCGFRGTAIYGLDYEWTPTAITFPAGVASTTVNIVPRNDVYAEGPETVELIVYRTWLYGVAAGQDRATVTLADDEPVVSVTASDPDASEDGDPGEFTITRTGDTASALAVSIQIGGTARNGRDHQWLPSTVIIPAGQPSVALAVAPVADPYPEPAETVTLTLVPAQGYAAHPAQKSATVVIAGQQ